MLKVAKNNFNEKKDEKNSIYRQLIEPLPLFCCLYFDPKSENILVLRNVANFLFI